MLPDFTILIIIVAILAIILLSILVYVFKRYKRCPSDQIMVIYGKVGKNAAGETRSAKCIHGGAAFIWPIFQECQFLSLKPFSMNIDLKNALSKQNIRVNVPSTFTVGISTDPPVMQNAAERLLGLDIRHIQELAQDIILGQMRLIIATMDIEELNTQRDKFMDAVSENVGKELTKIGLRLINANLTDIRDESGYIDALGKEAEAKAINEAKKNVAERNREGNTGEKNEITMEAIAIANKDFEEREGVAKAHAAAVAAEKDAETTQRAAIARANAQALAIEASEKAKAIAAVKDAETDQRAATAKADAAATAAEQEADSLKRAAKANANANAVDAENKAATAIAISVAKRREAEAQASARASSAEKVQSAIALSEAYAAEEKAEAARALREQATMNADIIIKAETEKKTREIAAEAEAEAIRRKAKGEADAILYKMQAQANGIKAQLEKRAEGFASLIKASNNDTSAAIKLMMTDKVDELMKTQVEAIKNIKVDKITVWDSMNGKDGTSTTSNFLSSVMKSIPPMQDVYNMIDMDLPANLAKPAEDKKLSPLTIKKP